MLNITKDWRDYNWYHAAPNAWCEVCGQVGNCGIEPRFGYTVCEDCSDTPPSVNGKPAVL